MDWIGVIAVLAGIILIIIGAGLVFNLPALMQFVEEVIGALCILLGAVALLFGAKLLRSV